MTERDKMGRRNIMKKSRLRLLGLIVATACIWVAYSLSQAAPPATAGDTTTDDASYSVGTTTEPTAVTDSDGSTSSTVYTTTASVLAPTEWSLADYPDYVRVIPNPVTIDTDVATGTISYSDLDTLGRSGRAIGRITYQMVEDSAGWRSSFASDVDSRLSGWGHNGKAAIDLGGGKSYSGYFWNRSHLIADSLGGYDVATGTTPVEDLVTGTRMQNVGKNDGDGGMAHFETRTVSYLKAHPDVSVWYSATPIYVGAESVCRSVYVGVLSSDGGLDMQGEVYNCANGYIIDYTTGTFQEG